MVAIPQVYTGLIEYHKSSIFNLQSSIPACPGLVYKPKFRY